MDIWGVGCVFFEMLSLFPLFPGTNEKDQVHKIHNILGTPSKEILERFQKYATHIDFNFQNITGTGIAQLIPHVTPECQDLIVKLLVYNPDERMSTRQALNSPFFKELRTQDTKVTMHKEIGGTTPTNNLGDDHSMDSQDPMQYPAKKLVKPADPSGYKKVQQGSKKWGEHDSEQNEYDDIVANNVIIFIDMCVVAADKTIGNGTGKEEEKWVQSKRPEAHFEANLLE